ncbi:hypothetical protein AB4526_25745 [Vibrio cyclitrophicus]
MNIEELLTLSAAILGSLGGGAAIIFGCSSWLGKVWANRLMEKEKSVHAQDLESLRSKLALENESFKIKMKKSELIFQKEYEAASEFLALKQSYLPAYKFAEMEWYNACDEIAQDFDKIEISLNKFLSQHGAVLIPDVREKLSASIGIAGEHKFEAKSRVEVPLHINKIADGLYANLTEIENSLLEKVHSQYSI